MKKTPYTGARKNESNQNARMHGECFMNLLFLYHLIVPLSELSLSEHPYDELDTGRPREALLAGVPLKG